MLVFTVERENHIIKSYYPLLNIYFQVKSLSGIIVMIIL
jgi:hypothetical protein